MLEAKKLAMQLRKKDRRRNLRGDWEVIEMQRNGIKGQLMWKKLKQKRADHLGMGTLAMLEEGVRAVAQTGFPHDETSSAAWASEFENFTFEPQDLDPDILASAELWKSKCGKAMGEDGWCEELIMLLQALGGDAWRDFQMAMALMAKHAALPRHQKGSLMKPILKPDRFI